MKIVFCLPGEKYSASFLMCWTNLVSHCISRGHNVTVMQRYSCNIYYVRNMCMGGDVLLGENQKPFNGQLDYDYVMWIDSDILFRPDQFQKLLDADKDIVSGLYLMNGGYAYATVEYWNEQFFQQHGTFEFMTPPMVAKKQDLFTVSYTGFGFILIKKGVFENMKYPWFKPEFISIGNSTDFTMEDVAWCRAATRLGYKIHVDPTVIVGHEKTTVY